MSESSATDKSTSLEYPRFVTSERNDWQPIDTAPKDGTWILIRGRNSANAPMVPVVCAWHHGVGIGGKMAWRDSASLRDMSHLLSDVPHDGEADWRPL